MTNKLIRKPAHPTLRRAQCRDFFGKGFCLRGNKCRFNHGLNPIVVDDSERFKVPATVNPNPPPPGMEEKAKTTSFVDLLLTPAVARDTDRPIVHGDAFPLGNALLREMEAQNVRIKLEAELRTAQLGMVQQSRRIMNLYEGLVGQLKILLRKLQTPGESTETKRQQANDLIKRIEGTKAALEGLFQQLTGLWAIACECDDGTAV
ncbi:hypothetical protein niasHT_007513 [Heterodera trifolii]|uniref:C3H1-type domain-containing protein n=1 Tax=Heterodera trifolii TaxID=157864 RepID=A0ABD2LPD4_9BILA